MYPVSTVDVYPYRTPSTLKSLAGLGFTTFWQVQLGRAFNKKVPITGQQYTHMIYTVMRVSITKKLVLSIRNIKVSLVCQVGFTQINIFPCWDYPNVQRNNCVERHFKWVISPIRPLDINFFFDSKIRFGCWDIVISHVFYWQPYCINRQLSL